MYMFLELYRCILQCCGTVMESWPGSFESTWRNGPGSSLNGRCDDHLLCASEELRRDTLGVVAWRGKALRHKMEKRLLLIWSALMLVLVRPQEKRTAALKALQPPQRLDLALGFHRV